MRMSLLSIALDALARIVSLKMAYLRTTEVHYTSGLMKNENNDSQVNVRC